MAGFLRIKKDGTPYKQRAKKIPSRSTQLYPENSVTVLRVENKKGSSSKTFYIKAKNTEARSELDKEFKNDVRNANTIVECHRINTEELDLSYSHTDECVIEPMFTTVEMEIMEAAMDLVEQPFPGLSAYIELDHLPIVREEKDILPEYMDSEMTIIEKGKPSLQPTPAIDALEEDFPEHWRKALHAFVA
jgi:hypothetical protein